MLLFLLSSFSSSKRYGHNDTVPVLFSRLISERDLTNFQEISSIPYCSFNFFYNYNQSEIFICNLSITRKYFDEFFDLIKNHFLYELKIDKLPVWSKIGFLSQSNQVFVYTHFNFNISFNLNRIIAVSFKTEKGIEVKPDFTLPITLSANWIRTTLKKKDRMSKYKSNPSCGTACEMTPIFISLACIFFLVFLLIFILSRILKNDIKRFESQSIIDDFDADFPIDSGWKLLHGDIFRSPFHPNLLSTILGFSFQTVLSILTFLIICYFFSDLFSKKDLFFIFNFAFSLYFAAGQMLIKLFQTRWNFTKSTLSFYIYIGFQVLVIVASWFLSKLTLKPKNFFRFFIPIFFILVGPLISDLLTLICHLPEDPCQPNLVRKKLPKLKFFLSTFFLTIIDGFFGFLLIFYYLKSILFALLSYRLAFLWGLVLLTIIVTMVFQALLTIFFVFLRLREDHYDWHWMSFLAPFSTSLYCLFYSISFFSNFEISPSYSHFLILFWISTVVGFICGFSGYFGSYLFLRYIYKKIRID